MELEMDSYQRFLNGDDSGLAEIICAYKDGLILYLHGYVNDLSTAEDLTEETFVKLVLKRPHFSKRSTFKTWLYAIGRNVALDYLRYCQKSKASLEEYPQLKDEEESMERAYIQQEDKRMLHQCMKKLKQEYRQVLWLAYFEGFTYPEISRILRKTTHNVETIAYRARRALKRILTQEGYVYENL